MMTDFFQFLNIDALTFLHWMLAVSISLFILDIFCQTEFISWVSLLTFALYFTLLIEHNMDLPVQWVFIVFFLFLTLAFVFYYAVWSKMINPAIKKSLLRKATVEYADRATGQTGTFRRIDEQCFVSWDGELWQAATDKAEEKLSQFEDREEVTITKSELGKLYITKHS